MRNCFRTLLGALVPILSGCAGHHSAAPLVSVSPESNAPHLGVTPHTAVYHVVRIDPDGRRTRVPNTTAYLKKGKLIGFKAGENHRLLAIAGDYEFDVTPTAPSVSLAWLRTTDRPTRASERTVIEPLPDQDEPLGKREAIIGTILTDPGAFTR